MIRAGEEWRPVVGYEDFYEVSSFGRLRSLDRMVRHSRGRFVVRAGVDMVGWPNRLGYRLVSLSRYGQRQDIFLHRLVCEAFHGPAPSPEYEVAHGDGNPGNCSADNLRWATHTENMGDKRAHGTFTCGERHAPAKLTLAEVKHILASRERGSDLARRFGVTPATICDIKKGRSWQEALLEDAA